ncbi:MAG: hypothetical protein ACRDZW_07945 [Acidimicrobiales bacterium]
MEAPDQPVRSRTERGRGWRSGLLAAGAAFGMTAAGLGIAGAQTGSTTTTTPSTQPGSAPATGEHPGKRMGEGLATAAKAIGISEADLRTALQSGQSIAQVAQSKGVAVSKVVDALVAEATANLPARITEMVNRTGGPGHFGGPGRHGGRHIGPALATAAKAIGISEADLRTAVQSGQSIAQVAQSKGVALSKVTDALVAEAKANLAAEVKDGHLTQAQADERSAKLVEHITELVNHTGGPGRHALPPPMS